MDLLTKIFCWELTEISYFSPWEVVTIVHKENFQLVLHIERLYSNEYQDMYQHSVFLVF